jgi:hypothetical protein
MLLVLRGVQSWRRGVHCYTRERDTDEEGDKGSAEGVRAATSV